MYACFATIQKINEYNQEMPQSLTVDQPTVPKGRATEHQQRQDTRNTIKAKQPALSLRRQDDCKARKDTK